ncbi:hypothetical protein P43SY_003831 [Pythium insidiosum]|uniref:PX domain-containing protein n=1 Tax=Pythium insidiosum TaxID=114742 RepID=A0AAD5LW26_PYTIN|nr:hypothetical protein P43SY_003831 [Pythium insidiosum]
MTGSFVFPPLAGLSPTRGAFTPSYSIDAFTEHSAVAVSRTPSTTALPEDCLPRMTDEELFRDLFSAENDSDGTPSSRKMASRPRAKPTPKKTPMWTTGATMSMPFPPSVPPMVTAAPTSSVSVPRVERNTEEDDVFDLWTGSLGQVLEANEDECDERPETEERAVKAVPGRPKVVPASPGLSLQKASASALQQETLTFLERLDLKLLLSSRPPDVANFFPTAPATSRTLAAVDARLEVDSPRNAGEAAQRPAKQPTGDSASARLAHVALAYGTTAKTKKARQGTFDRLANPILGHSSTLQALSPEQRKKREALFDLPLAGSQNQRSDVDSSSKLGRVTAAYEAAASSSAQHLRQSKPVVSPTRGGRLETARALNNQEEDAEAASVVPATRSTRKSRGGRRNRRLEERKSELKQRIATRESMQSPTRAHSVERATAATFLTQPEEIEAPPQVPAQATSRAGDGQPAMHMPTRPSLPPAVRARGRQRSSGHETPTTEPRYNRPSRSLIESTKRAPVTPKKPVAVRKTEHVTEKPILPQPTSRAQPARGRSRQPKSEAAARAAVHPPQRGRKPAPSTASLVLLGTEAAMSTAGSVPSGRKKTSGTSTTAASGRAGSRPRGSVEQKPTSTAPKSVAKATADAPGRRRRVRASAPPPATSGSTALPPLQRAPKGASDRSSSRAAGSRRSRFRGGGGGSVAAAAMTNKAAEGENARAKPMDPGLVTSERGPHRRHVAVAPLARGQLESPLVTCRSCRRQIALDDMESHECDPADVKAAASSPRASASPTASTSPTSSSSSAMLDVAARASSFLDSFLDAKQDAAVKTLDRGAAATTREHVRRVEPVLAPAPAPPVSVYRPTTPSPRASVSSSPPLPPPPAPTPLTHRLSDVSSVVDAYAAPPHLRAAGRAHSATNVGPEPAPSRQTSASSVDATAPLLCRVRGVRLNKNKVALYSIVSTVPGAQREVIVERRYREFYAFALAVHAMFPSPELWARLPPKTFCNRGQHRSDGFLLRRKNGLDDFVRSALQLMSLGADAPGKGTIGQWYLVRRFLNLPPTLAPLTMPQSPTASVLAAPAPVPTKDRSLETATKELKRCATETKGWLPVVRVDEHDTTLEKTADGFPMVKRVKDCPFPARAVFDMIVKRVSGAEPSNQAEADASAVASTAEPTPSDGAGWNPAVLSMQILRRENHQTWTERTIFKGQLMQRDLEMISIKTWKVEDDGSIVIVMIPAEDRADVAVAAISGTASACSRVDCVLGGWIITPTPGEETCTVTWLMQVNFGECDPESEFTGSQGLVGFLGRRFLLLWADEITHLLHALEQSYDPAHYRKLGPLLSGGDFRRLKLDRRDTQSANAVEDPRVYVLARELEPSMCLLIHKNLNTNVLIFKTNLRKASADVDTAAPLKAEWIMFEKEGNPRQDLSAIERSTTYTYSTRHVGPNLFQFSMELLRRDCTLRYDPAHGFALFTTISGKPNVLLKRVYLSYGKSSRLSFSRVEEVILFGTSDMEIVTLAAK